MILRSILFTFILFFTSLTSLQAEVFSDRFKQDTIDRCKEEIIEAFIKGLNDKDKKILGKLSNITALKLAGITSSYNKQYLEDALIRYEEDLKEFNESDITSLKSRLDKTYNQEIKDHNALIENILAKNNFRRPNERLSNTDLFHFVALYRHQNPEGEFRAHDEAILWLNSKASNYLKDSYGSYSLPHNSSEYSNKVSKLLEGNKSFTDLREKLVLMENEVINELKKIQDEFRREFPLCYDDNGMFLGLCSEQKDFLHNVMNEALLKNLENIQELRAEVVNGNLKLEMSDKSWEFIPLDQILEHKAEEKFLIAAPLRFESIIDTEYHNRNYLAFKDRKAFQHSLHGLPQAERVKSYMTTYYQENPEEKGLYAIVDKNDKTISIFNGKSELEQGLAIAIPNTGDQSRNSGAGEWTFIGGIQEIILTNRQGHKVVFPLLDTKEKVKLRPNDRVIILPSDPLNDIYIRDGKLSLETTKRFKTIRERQDLNEGTKTLTAKETIFLPLHPEIRTSVSIEFAKTLGDEKANLMKLYNLSNEEYNELARLAFGILGNESKFGTSYKYHVKESIPLVVSLAKGEWFDTSSNSRGPTQIKTIPSIIATNYGITKSTLSVPKNAAIATLGFLAQSMTELRAHERKHPGINPLNRYDFLHYIYTGRVSEILNGTGTPEKNIYFRNLTAHADKLIILEER
jgi:hypothetical protein